MGSRGDCYRDDVHRDRPIQREPGSANVEQQPMTPVDDPDTAALEDPEHAESGGICERAPEPDNAGTRSYWKGE